MKYLHQFVTGKNWSQSEPRLLQNQTGRLVYYLKAYIDGSNIWQKFTYKLSKLAHEENRPVQKHNRVTKRIINCKSRDQWYKNKRASVLLYNRTNS